MRSWTASKSSVLAKLAESGVIRPDERVVAYVTGNGLKTLDAVAPFCQPTATIKPTIEAFNSAIDLSGER